MRKLLFAALFVGGSAATVLSAKESNEVSLAELQRHCANYELYGQTGEKHHFLTCHMESDFHVIEGSEKFPMPQESGAKVRLYVKGNRGTDWIDVGGPESVVYGSCPQVRTWRQELTHQVDFTNCREILAAKSQKLLCAQRTKAIWSQCDSDLKEALALVGKSGEFVAPTTNKCRYEQTEQLVSCGGEPEVVGKQDQSQTSDDDFGQPVQVDASGRIDPDSVGADLKMETCFRKITNSATSARIIPRSCVEIQQTPAEGSLLGVITENGRSLQKGDCIFAINGKHVPSRKKLKQTLQKARNAEQPEDREVFIQYHAKGNLKKDPNFIDFTYGS